MKANVYSQTRKKSGVKLQKVETNLDSGDGGKKIKV